MTEQIELDENGHFSFLPDWSEIPASAPSWERLDLENGFEFLFYAGPAGCRCWQLLGNGTMTEVTDTVIPKRFRVGYDPEGGGGVKVGDKVTLNEGAKGLPVGLAAKFRTGDKGVVSEVLGRVYIKVDVEKKGIVRIPASWVDRD